MVPVGVLLLVLAVAFGAGFLVSPGDTADIGFYGLMLQDLSARNLVILGIITGLIAALGAESIRWGTARWRRRRRIARKKERELDTEHTGGEVPASVASDEKVPAAENSETATQPVSPTSTDDLAASDSPADVTAKAGSSTSSATPAKDSDDDTHR